MRNNIRKYRKELRWSQEKLGIEVAQRTGELPTGKSGVSKWESGNTERLAENTMLALSDIFSRPIDDIFRTDQSIVDCDGKILINGLVQLFDKNIGEQKMQNVKGLKTLQVADNSNEPALYVHWLVRYYDRKKGIDQNAIDLPAVVKLMDGTIFVRKLQAGSKQDRWHLTTLNNIGAPIIDAELEWAAAIHSVLPRKNV